MYALDLEDYIQEGNKSENYSWQKYLNSVNILEKMLDSAYVFASNE